MKMEEVDQAVNGVENINIDEDDHEKNYRPPDIDADVRDMERRKRVEAMMASRIFKEELERIVEHHSRDGGTIFSSQNLSDIFGSGSRMKTGAIIPINDIKGPESLFYIKGEKMLRCKLAALYRLVDLHGWTQSIYNHITVRINQDQEHFLINPFGLLYHEVTASSLVKVDMQGNIVDPGSSNFSVNVAGFMLHSAIHQARPDVKCVIHMHLPSVVAVSAMKCGLLPLSQEACIIGPVSYHPFEGILVDAGERVRIAENMGPKNKVMLLRNHGFVACGETIEEAWVLAYHTVLACEAQMKMLPIGIDNLITISEEAIQRTAEAVRAGVASKGESADIQATSISHGVDESDLSLRDESGAQKPGKREKKWRVGEMEFEAYMRMLDNAGYRTGYMYRQPVVKNEVPRQKLDIEVPPSVSSFGYQIEGEEAYRDLIKKLLEGKKSSERAKWINSPNVYQKVEVLETGTQDPKKITKWVADSSPTHSTPVKVDPALQFVPVGTNPKEFKLKQKAIKENRRAGGISAGPQSHILEGVSWEEMKKMQEAQTNGDQVVIVGAASKGIIQRDFQHHALVYKTPYAKNPFDNISNEEIDSYKKEIEKNMRGDLTIEEYPEYQQEQEDSFVSTNLSSIATPHQLTAESVTLPDTPHPEDVTLSPPQSPPPAASDLEDEGLSSTSSHQVLTVEANTLPRPSRAEKQLLPDHGSGMPTPHVERSKSARFPRDQGSLIEVSVDPEDFYLVETDDDYASSDMEEEGHILLRSSLQTKEALKKIFDCEFNETITQQGFLSRSQSLSDLGIIRTFSLDLRKSPSFPSLLVLESFKLGVRSMASVYFDCANPVGFQDSVDSLGVSNVLSANALKPEYSKVEMTELNNDKEFDLCCSSPVSDNAHDVFEDCFEENDDAKCINYGFIYETENVEAVDDDIDDNVCTIPPNDLSICSENDINRDSDKMNEKDNNFVERRDFILNLADDPNFGFEKESIRCENVSMNRDEDVYSENSEFYLENYPDLLNSLHQTDDIIAGMVSDDTVNQVDEFMDIHVHPNLSSSMENLFKETGPPPSSSSSGYSSQAESSVCIVENDSPEMLRAEPLSSESYFRFNSLRSKCVTVFPPIFERSIEIPSPSFNCKESKIRVATDLFDPVVFEIETSYAPGPVKDQPELVFIDEDAGSEGSCLSWDYNCCEDHPHFISMDKEKEDTITSEPAIPRYSPLKSPSLVRKADELE